MYNFDLLIYVYVYFFLFYILNTLNNAKSKLIKNKIIIQ